METARYKILLVEDNEIDRMAFKRFVEEGSLPYDCTVAGSVSEARGLLGTERFDIVISDYRLGDGTAFDILDLVKDIPTILVTGAGDEEIAIKAWRAGAYDYLVKDLEHNYLRAVPITVENAVKHKRMEEKLQLLSCAVTSANDSIYITDMEDRIIFVNKAFCKTYGYKEEEIIGKSSNILWIDREQSQNTRSVFQTRSVGSGWEVGFYHRRRDNSIFPVSLSRSVIKNSKGTDTAIVGVARDISERIFVEDELRTTIEGLKKQNEQKSELAIMATGALKLALVEKDIDRALRVATDFLDISKIDTGTIELKHNKFGFESVVSQVLEGLSPLAAEKGIELNCAMPDGELVVNADYDRIVQALTNLVSRSIKSVRSNGHIDVQVKDAGSQVAVEIRDDGSAVTGDEIQNILDTSGWIKEHFDAGEYQLALGLPIAKELIELHGGCVWIESTNAGEQNIFCFVLPKADVQQEVSAGAESGLSRSEAKGSHSS